ncbi:MAG: TetR/AcrR family transcriptional regulator [Gemmatimonadota bacterium]|nr:TetR/AcrR family transcriptional regulator [Gemmatimonadota bacterium]
MQWNETAVRTRLVEISGRLDPDDPKERTRRRIVKAASELFIDRGYKKTSVDEIADRAGVSKATIYAYAENKASLLMLALVEEKLDHIDSILPIIDESRPAAARMKEMVETVLVAGVRWPLTARVLERDRDFLHALDQLEERFQVHQDETGTALYESLIEAATSGRFTQAERRERAKALTALGFLSVMLNDSFVRQGMEVERIAELIAEMIVVGLVPQPPSQFAEEVKSAVEDAKAKTKKG